MGILPFLAMCFMVMKGFVYAISADIYAFLLAFSTKLHRILPHNALRLAPKRTAFSTKTRYVLGHIALHLAAKRTKVGVNGVLFK